MTHQGSRRTKLAQTDWPRAARSTVRRLAMDVRRGARAAADGDEAGVHDVRTATRRLRTALSVYRDVLPRKSRKRAERELRRVTRRLGAVRDLDVMISTLAHAPHDMRSDSVRPLRRAWVKERRACRTRLRSELRQPPFDRVISSLGRLRPGADAPHLARMSRVADLAPAHIRAAAQVVLASEIDPLTADPTQIHELRIAAKELRYTLELFDLGSRPSAASIDEVTALQDAAGDMHDAIVAGERARTFLESQSHLSAAERAGINRFAQIEDRRAEDLRHAVNRRLGIVRGTAFRHSVNEAIALINAGAAVG